MSKIENLYSKFKKILVNSRKSKDICIEELNDILNKEKAILIDVRSKQEYNEGHINGAICIPSYEIHSEIEQKIIDKNQIIILYCKSGIRSKKAQRILINMGYKNVYNLFNGIDAIK